MNKSIFIELRGMFWKYGHSFLSEDDMVDLSIIIQNVLEEKGYMSEMIYTQKDLNIAPVNRIRIK